MALNDVEIDPHDLPFMAPPNRTFTIDLPMPPSVNALWKPKAGQGRKGVVLSPAYISWKANADNLVLFKRSLRGLVTISTMFEATILLDSERGNRGDLDNRAKAVLDWAQSRAVILNDKFCRRLIMEWVGPRDAPEGCRLTVKELG